MSSAFLVSTPNIVIFQLRRMGKVWANLASVLMRVLESSCGAPGVAELDSNERARLEHLIGSLNTAERIRRELGAEVGK